MTLGNLRKVVESLFSDETLAVIWESIDKNKKKS